MAYIGNTPAESFASFEKQVFTIVNSQTAYTLNHAVTNENEIRLVVNNVVQEPGSGKAFTASGTTLTLSAALVNGTDEMYCVFLGRALQTVNPPNASVGSDQTAPTIITGQTAETSIATDDTILIHDTSASALRKMTRANFVSGIGGTNTPLIQVSLQTAAQTITDSSQTKIAYNYVQQNVGGTWDSTNYRWTPGTAGKYFIAMSTMISADSDSDLGTAYSVVKMNGTIEFYFGTVNHNVQGYGRTHQTVGSVIKTMDDDDYIEGFAFLNTISGNNGRLDGELKQTWLTAYKIIT
jgi:hypothetical protein